MEWCTSSGVSIRFELSGRGSKILILLHELGGSLESWDDVVPVISEHFTVLRFDQRGAGLSEKVRQPFTMQDHAHDLKCLLDFLGLQPPYLFASVAAGAPIILTFAKRFPTTAKGMLLCSAATEVSQERKEYLQARSIKAAQYGMSAIVDDALAKSFPSIVIRDIQVYVHYRGRFLANDPVCYAFANQALAQFELNQFIDDVQCPVLLLAGRYDLLRPVDQIERLGTQLSRASVKIVDAGHLMSIQNPEAVGVELMTFDSTL